MSTTPRWHVVESLAEDESGTPPAPVATLHFLRGALRRRWRVWVALALVGLLLGAAWTALGTTSRASTTITLAHQTGSDPAQAMATDMGILGTRTVAARTVAALGLKLTPEQFQRDVATTQLTTSIVQVTVTATDNATAVRWTRTLARTYLAFRADQIQAQAKAEVAGNTNRANGLQQRVAQLTDQYNVLSSGSADDRDQAADVLTQRSQLTTQISTLQQSSQDTSLQSQAIVTASGVLDPAAVVPQSTLKRWGLALLSGLIGGAALGIGYVLLGALTSDRLRTREEVALALGAPVRHSVPGLSRGDSRWRRLLRPRSQHDDPSLQVLGAAIDSVLVAGSSRESRLAIGTIDGSLGAEILIASLAVRLSGEGRSVFLVDLSSKGGLEAAVTRALRAPRHTETGDPSGPSATPTVFRPDGVPSLARGPLGGSSSPTALPRTDPRRQAWDAADVIVTLVDVDPAIGVDELTTWSRRLVLLVTAGSSSAERLRTTGELIRSAGLQLVFALLLGADRDDETLGRPDTSEQESTTASRRVLS